MSERLQSGIHPDADQLNAFVEHALPPHEREQTLAHLAECAACRSIVSLSLAPVDEVVQPQATPARRPWFLGWNLAWPVAAALAALVPLTLYIHRIVAPGRIAAPTETATSQPPAAPPAPPAAAPFPTASAPASPAAKAAPSRAAAEKPAPSPPATPKSASAGMPQPRAPINTADATLGGTLDNQLYSQLPLSMNGGPRDRRTPGAQDKPAGTAGAGRSNGNSGIYGGTGQANLNENYVEGVPVPNAAPPPPPPAAAPAVPAAAAAASASAASETVTVTDAQAALGTSDASFGALTLKTVAPRAPLPSGLPMLSTATSGRLVLALDSGNTLFFSDDGGRRWKPVSAQWRGRAVSVAVANPPAAQFHGALQRSGVGGAAPRSSAITGANTAPAAPAASSPNPGVAGTVTDPTGAVIPDASVVVTDAAKQAFRNARTDPAGHYRIDGLAPGSYQLEARAAGFQALELPVTVAAAQQSVANIRLQVGSATETVTVTAAPAISIDETSSAETANAKKVTPSAAQAPPAPLFEITTESGDHWTSPDGQTWTRRP